MSRFDEIMNTVLKWEGGYVNNPYDNGGPTNYGITHEVLAAWRGVASVSPNTVKNMKRDEALAIFKSRYWEKVAGDELPSPIDLIVMDGAVNHGVQNMARLLQTVLSVSRDGQIGPETIKALADQTNSQQALLDVAVKLADARKARYLAHEDAAHFIAGWRNRLNDVMSVALEPYGIGWSFKSGRTDGPGETILQPIPVSTILTDQIADVDLQSALAAMGTYHGDIDGLFGPRSAAALDEALRRHASIIAVNWERWPLPQRKIALGQLICLNAGIEVGPIDGLFGPSTKHAFEEFNRRRLGLPQDQWRDHVEGSSGDDLPGTPQTWPRERDVPAFFGDLGENCGLVPHKKLFLPFKMKLAWDLGTEIDGFRIHEKVHDSAARVFKRVYDHYGQDGIEDLGLNLFGGCHACRRKRGGSGRSMHAWSIAIDFDPARNSLRWNHTRARLAKADAVKFWELWEGEGWVSLGRSRDFDWMHVQAARL